MGDCEKPKYCPFCGCGAKVYSTNGFDGTKKYFVECMIGCVRQVMVYDTPERAVEIWNRRNRGRKVVR